MLERLKILDFTTLLPGPFATLYLADMGAEVLRITAPDRVDLVSELEPKIEGTGAAECYLGRNKRTMTLDLKTEEGVDIVEKLIADKGYDIVIEQFRPGVMEKLGLSYDTLSAICPNLIYLSLTGYGATGPYRLRAGHDIGYLAKAGLYSHSGRADAIPTPLGTQIADLSGSLNAVIAILAAVEKRNAGHGGSYIDLSMFDCALPWNSLDSYTHLAGGELPAPEEGLLNGGSLYDLYETKDGKTLAMGAKEGSRVKANFRLMNKKVGEFVLAAKAFLLHEFAAVNPEQISGFRKSGLKAGTGVNLLKGHIAVSLEINKKFLQIFVSLTPRRFKGGQAEQVAVEMAAIFFLIKARFKLRVRNHDDRSAKPGDIVSLARRETSHAAFGIARIQRRDAERRTSVIEEIRMDFIGDQDKIVLNAKVPDTCQFLAGPDPSAGVVR